MYAASSADLYHAGKDKLTRDLGRMISDLEQPGRLDVGLLSKVRTAFGRLNSYTHTGFQQIGARLTADGIGYDYDESEVLDALRWAEVLSIMALVGFAELAKNELLARAALERARAIGTTAG